MYHLYTIASLIMAIMLLRRLLNGPPPPPRPPCAHNWELVDKTEFASPFDELTKNGVGFKGWSMLTPEWTRMSSKKIVLVLRCTKCDSAPIVKEFTA